MGKLILPKLLQTGKSAKKFVEKKGLLLISDVAGIKKMVDVVLGKECYPG
jgi:Asp-tRNA(Asn)/Glu-tRNA(Gln) amidotransferase B subunit